MLPASMLPEPKRAGHGVRSVATSIVSRGTVVFLNMFTGILTARMLHPDGRGELAAMNLWPLFLAYATALGTPTSLIYHLRRHPERRNELIASALALVLVLGSLAALLGALVLPHWLTMYPPGIVRFAQIFLVAVPLWSIQLTGQAALEAMEQFSSSNVVQLMIPAVTLAALLTVWGTVGLTPVTAAACYVSAILPAAVAIVLMLGRTRGGAAWRVSVTAWKTLLGYGIRSAPLDLLGTLMIYIDQVLVIGLLSAASMGSYSVVLSLSRALLVFQSAVVMVLFPKAAGRETGEILQMVGRAVRASTLVTGVAAVSAALLGPTLLRLLYGRSYLMAVPALRVLLMEVVLQGVVVILSQAFMAAGRPGTVSMLQGVGLGLAVPLMFLFIPHFGDAGAALALLCSTTTRLVLLLLFAPRVLKSRLPRLIPGPADVRMLWGYLPGRSAR